MDKDAECLFSRSRKVSAHLFQKDLNSGYFRVSQGSASMCTTMATYRNSCCTNRLAIPAPVQKGSYYMSTSWGACTILQGLSSTPRNGPRWGGGSVFSKLSQGPGLPCTHNGQTGRRQHLVTQSLIPNPRPVTRTRYAVSPNYL